MFRRRLADQEGHEGAANGTLFYPGWDTNGHQNDVRWCYGQAQPSRGVSRRFSEAEWLKSRGKVAKTDPEPFCDFRRLWYTPTYKFSAQQGWRHGVRLRSLGSTNVAI
jgi:hypothetical protein